MNDDEIAECLQQSKQLTPVECGGGGNCLFLSISDQVTQRDVDHANAYLNVCKVSEALAASPWDRMPRCTRGQILRCIAVSVERKWLSEGANPQWRKELFLDMAQELLTWRANDVQKHLRSWPLAQQEEFIASRHEEYCIKEEKVGTYAGTAEAWALSAALGRSIELWGNDYASSPTVRCIDGELQPYFRYVPEDVFQEDVAIHVLQVWGGGHYQMLSHGPPSQSPASL